MDSCTFWFHAILANKHVVVVVLAPLVAGHYAINIVS